MNQNEGVLGGTVHEAMTDVIKLMGTLVDCSGKILVNGVMDDVKPVTAEEEALYESIEFDLEAYKEESKVKSVSNKLLHDDKKSLLQHRWRFPTCSLHGIEGAFHGPGAKTVIPSKVIGKFSLRLVPEQKPGQIERVVKQHIETEFAKVNNGISFALMQSSSTRPMLTSGLPFSVCSSVLLTECR